MQIIYESEVRGNVLGVGRMMSGRITPSHLVTIHTTRHPYLFIVTSLLHNSVTVVFVNYALYLTLHTQVLK